MIYFHGKTILSVSLRSEHVNPLPYLFLLSLTHRISLSQTSLCMSRTGKRKRKKNYTHLHLFLNIFLCRCKNAHVKISVYMLDETKNMCGYMLRDIFIIKRRSRLLIFFTFYFILLSSFDLEIIMIIERLCIFYCYCSSKRNKKKIISGPFSC